MSEHYSYVLGHADTEIARLQLQARHRCWNRLHGG
jgi:hypothetical protein